MCGIFGYWSQSELSSVSILETSKLVWDSMGRRGPDSYGGVAIGCQHFIYDDGTKSISEASELVLLHSRLSIIDLGAGGHQPMSTKHDRFWTVFNGEIYNHKILRSELEALGSEFSSDSDTEVIIQGFEKYGIDIFDRLEGMFAIAIYDSVDKALYLARDRVGIKPLYYTRNDRNRIIFSSEQQTIFDSKLVAPSINWSGVISNYQFNGALRPGTVYEDLFSVKPGNYLRITEMDVEEKVFANLINEDFTHELPSKDIKYNLQRLDKITADSVESTLISDVEIATLLSGGIDSAMLAAYATQKLPNLKAYTLVWPKGESPSESEFDKSREIAKILNLDHRIVSVSSREVEDSIEEIFDLFEEPMGMIEPHYFIAKALNKDGIKVVLNGIGPDETLGGYGWYLAQEKYLMLKKYSFIFNSFASNSYKNKKRKNLLNSKDWFEFYTLVFQRFSISSDDIFTARVTNVGKWREEVRELYGSCPGELTPIQFLNYLDLMVYVGTHHNHSCDKFLMHQGVEGRFPFLNDNWINFTFWLPDEFKRKDGTSKLIWHELSKKYFPPNYFQGPKKGFGLPNDLLEKSSKLQYLFDVSINNLIMRGVVVPDIGQILKKINSSEVLSLKLYLLSLSMWLNKVGG